MTDKAVDAAVEKIVTQKKPATETSAVELAAEFVKPGRVARQAKKRLEPAPSQSPEKAKTEYWETPEYKAKLALTEAERKWRENVSDSLTESLRAQPGRLASLVMLVLAGKLQRQMSTKELSRAEEAIKLTVKPTWQNLLQLEKRCWPASSSTSPTSSACTARTWSPKLWPNRTRCRCHRSRSWRTSCPSQLWRGMHRGTQRTISRKATRIRRRDQRHSASEVTCGFACRKVVPGQPPVLRLTLERSPAGLTGRSNANNSVGVIPK